MLFFSFYVSYNGFELFSGHKERYRVLGHVNGRFGTYVARHFRFAGLQDKASETAHVNKFPFAKRLPDVIQHAVQYQVD